MGNKVQINYRRERREKERMREKGRGKRRKKDITSEMGREREREKVTHPVKTRFEVRERAS